MQFCVGINFAGLSACAANGGGQFPNNWSIDVTFFVDIRAQARFYIEKISIVSRLGNLRATAVAGGGGGST